MSNVTIEELKELRFSIQKARYIIGVSNSFKSGDISREMLMGMTTVQLRQKTLTNLKGIGIWTANYTLMKTLREPNLIPYGDIGLLNALTKYGIIKLRSETDNIDKFFAKYQGWESYLVFYLWRSLKSPV
jgi:DNA-3-methyladenine glycosylase II